ncbi:hypothetical protein BJ508DRAFT_334800 [Ascobolus immersus RN42]|uniref:Uncharacterized protein n=1 Tax=Ascobolus immersus RN42 TaxID=1160509 RepID=A0A3N4HLE8_ASCIM|nr:hypothetical protein BJ508DRAFT_334800 [Ascobolus immersus RN42]
MKFNSNSLLTALLCLPFLTAASPLALAESGVATAAELAEIRSQVPVYDLDLPEYAADIAAIDAAIQARSTPELSEPETAKLFRRQYPTICETSTGSPSVNNVISAYAYLHSLGNQHCGQTNCCGSKCTTMVRRGDAAIAVCGSQYFEYCTRFGDAARLIVQRCQSGGRVGGQSPWTSGMRLIVVRS